MYSGCSLRSCRFIYELFAVLIALLPKTKGKNVGKEKKENKQNKI